MTQALVELRTELGEEGGKGNWRRQQNLWDTQIVAVQREIMNLRASSA